MEASRALGKSLFSRHCLDYVRTHFLVGSIILSRNWTGLGNLHTHGVLGSFSRLLSYWAARIELMTLMGREDGYFHSFYYL
jgi:hypothetical protein